VSSRTTPDVEHRRHGPLEQLLVHGVGRTEPPVDVERDRPTTRRPQVGSAALEID
jgi:hypothetical protein